MASIRADGAVPSRTPKTSPVENTPLTAFRFTVMPAADAIAGLKMRQRN